MATRTVSTAASELFPRNSSRKSWIITNEDSADSVFLKFERDENTTVSATIHDYKIGPGGNIASNTLTDGLSTIQSRVTVIASANTPRVSWFESEDIVR